MVDMTSNQTKSKNNSLANHMYNHLTVCKQKADVRFLVLHILEKSRVKNHLYQIAYVSHFYVLLPYNLSSYKKTTGPYFHV